MASPLESDPTTELDQIAGSVPATAPGPTSKRAPAAKTASAAKPESSTNAEPAEPDPSLGFDRLLELFQEVTRARAALTVARRAPLGRSRLVDAPRTALLMSLEAYTAELNARNLPVPYGIRDDLRIQRRILGRVVDASG